MTLFILLALLNGFCIAISRIWNGQLASYSGAFKASYVNHITGFIFLSIVMILLFEPPQLSDGQNMWVYLGGFIGAIYVAINSLAMSHLGSTNTMVLVIGGQMCFGLFLDSSTNSPSELLIKVLSVMSIVIGVYLKQMIQHKRTSLAS
ncbi:DMT family transporter [Moritella sp. Urea-trap-13]|uniref:DMT family transporter n=1 Tax=Moritella sp. Urea-trap-13 TaxID=2058327 RepID=UPI000C3461EC|nr:DMT family transporter [Moritella sp. Urea-trap-13]PKH06359.1 EamA-like transporter family protein [Moritella sp. Urea-trap-13]